MLIRIIQENAEYLFLDAIEEYNKTGTTRGVLICSFSKVPLKLIPDEMLSLFKEILKDLEASIYFCINNDVVITWKGQLRETSEAIQKKLCTQYRELENVKLNEIFVFYDSNAQGEDLRIIFRNKILSNIVHISQIPPANISEIIDTKPGEQVDFSDVYKATLRKSLEARKKRKEIVILIVEDQLFSIKLLTGILQTKFKCYSATNALQAIDLYAEHAPDITFLDIELPDLSGHELATIFNKYDSGNFLVMVTANNNLQEVVEAKKNNVKGFVVKPYSKEKILSVIQIFMNKTGKR